MRKQTTVSIHFLAALLLILSAAPSQAQDNETQKNNGIETLQYAMTFVGQGKPLAAIHTIENSSIDQALAADMLAALYSFVGEWEKTLTYRSIARKNNVVSPPTEFSSQLALDAIVERSREKRIVIINEAHDSPEHRAFIALVAKKLYKLGFRYYAFETLNESPQLLAKRTYPVLSTGFYSVEPAFGQLIRDALANGYTPVAYEAVNPGTTAGGSATDPISQINRREQGQCDNLVKRVFSMDSEARVLLHVGHDHAMETARKAGENEILWLAARLKQETGFDPLTVDQTTLLSRFPESQDTPIAFSNANGQFFVGGHFENAVDVQVFHPAVVNKRGRPSWMFDDATRVPVEIPDELTSTSKETLIQAFYVGEELAAIPADQIVVHNGQPKPIMLLRPASYRVVAQDAEGQESSRTTLIVEP